MISRDAAEVGLQLNDGSRSMGRQGTHRDRQRHSQPHDRGRADQRPCSPILDRELLSGTIGNVILQGVNTDAILVPMTATVELQDKIIAYRLKNGKAEAAYLTVDRLNDGNHFVVEQGLSVGDTLITEGVGQLKEGMNVTPKTTKP